MRAAAASILLSVLRDTQTEESESAQDEMTDDILRRIYDLTVYINSHYSENLSAAECAAKAYMSYSYFSRCFFRVTGKSFKDYLNTARVNNAEKLLCTTDKSVTLIATECGFNNVSYFITVYKRLKGMTPHAARKC